MSKKNQTLQLSESSEDEVVVPVAKPSKPTSLAKKQKRRINPIAAVKQPTSHDLFGTDTEDEEAEQRTNKNDGARYKETNENPRKRRATTPPTPAAHLGEVTNEAAVKKRKLAASSIAPADCNKKVSAKDVFGSDSEEEGPARPGKKAPAALTSYFTKRMANGLSRQINNNKNGTHYIELKVYKCDEIKNIQPMNRWRHAIITIKNKTDDDTEAWEHLTEFVKATRQEFKDCRPDVIGSYGYSCY